MAVTLLYQARSKNSKTGNIPQQFIGGTREESKETCQGCPLLANHHCYAQFRSEGWAHSWMVKRQEYKDYTLDTALTKKAETAKYFRFGAIGEPAAISKPVLIKAITKIKEAGLGILSYTHFWHSRGQHLKGLAMASCDTWEQVKQAVKSKWRATIVVEKSFIAEHGSKGTLKIKGRKKPVRWAQCPFQTHGTQCNDCGLCDPTKEYLIPVIVFERH